MNSLTLPRAGTGLLALFLAFVLGCAQLGLPTPATLNEKIATAQGSVTQIRVTAAQLLIAKKISSGDAENVLAQTDNAAAGIAVARTIAAQDPAAAQARLVMITTVLTALQAYLATKQP